MWTKRDTLNSSWVISCFSKSAQFNKNSWTPCLNSRFRWGRVGRNRQLIKNPQQTPRLMHIGTIVQKQKKTLNSSWVMLIYMMFVVPLKHLRIGWLLHRHPPCWPWRHSPSRWPSHGRIHSRDAIHVLLWMWRPSWRPPVPAASVHC